MWRVETGLSEKFMAKIKFAKSAVDAAQPQA